MQRIKSVELERIVNTMITRQIQMIRDELDYNQLKQELNVQCNKEAVINVGWVLSEDAQVKEMFEYLPSEQAEVDKKTINNNTFVQKKALRGV
jgi:hypothetical protein